MKILFVWTGVTSYMADCWRKLQQQEGVELKVVIEMVASGRDFDAAAVLQGLDYQIVNSAAECDPAAFARPDVMFAVGWHSRVVRTFVEYLEWKSVPKVCCFDLPWRWKLRCIAAKFVLWPFLRKYSAAYVPGAACERYARWLGFPLIYKGLFSINTEVFSPPSPEAPRTGFLYVGRYADEKRLDLLYAAYHLYRTQGGRWPLDLYGSGSLPPYPTTHLAVSAPVAHPFAQPSAIPQIYSSHACLVLSSAFDPWPLVVLQACANAMSVIITDRCTNHYELVKENGLVVKFGDVEALAEAMHRAERGELQGSAGLPISRPYSTAQWVTRVLALSQAVIFGCRGPVPTTTRRDKYGQEV